MGKIWLLAKLIFLGTTDKTLSRLPAYFITGCSSVDRAGALGASGREFKPHHSDHLDNKRKLERK